MHIARVRLLVGLALTAAVAALPSSASAQDSVFRSATAPSGRTTRVAVVPNITKDCKPGAPGSIRVVTPPKNGSLIVRAGKVKTPATYRCPNIDATVQALFYKPNNRYTGSDEIVIETKLPDGNPQTVTVRITVTDKPSPSDKGLIDL